MGWKRYWLIAGVLAGSFAPSIAHADTLDEVEVRLRRDGSASIRVRFTNPVQATRFVPQSVGRILYISLSLPGLNDGTRPHSERATNFGNLNGRLPLEDVTLELNGAEGDRLIVGFKRTTRYKIFQGRDGKSIVIIVPASSLSKATAAPARPPADAEPPRFTGPLTGKMARARQLLIKGNNKQAIVLFRQIVGAKPNRDTRDANELLGLAYERDGQLGKARAQYERYLKLYPKGPGADRVRQRLRNLTRAPRRPQLKAGRGGGPGQGVLVYGTFSQRLYTGISNSSVGSNVDQTTLISNLTVTSRKRTEKADHKAVLSADHTYDFINQGSTGRIQNAYLESKLKWHKVSGKFGRQSGRGAGVLGRFDGALVGGDVINKWRVNAVAGRPVDISASGSDRQFSGVSIDAGTFAGKWSATLFQIGATADGFTDRQAVGTEVRYFDKTTTVFSMVDYDTYFNDMNVAMVQAYWKAKDNWSYNILLDSRKAPYLQLTNSLLAPVNGTSYDSISALAAGQPSLDLKQLAKDRTAASNTISLGATLPDLKQFGVKSKFLRKIQLGGDLSYSSVSSLPASAGQSAVAGSETTTLTGRAIGTKLFFDNEITVAGLSFINNTSYRAFAAYLTDRNRIRNKWRLDLGLKWYTQDNSSGTSLIRLTPSVRVEYRRNKTTFEFELGRESSQSINPLQNENIDRDFVTIGYRYDF